MRGALLKFDEGRTNDVCFVGIARNFVFVLYVLVGNLHGHCRGCCPFMNQN